MVKNLNYGIIGNCRTSALVSENGSIDWCCLPDPDSPAVFGRILDDNKGGHFSVHTQNEYIVSQKYQGDTNIVVTTFTNENNTFEIIDFMPRYMTDQGNYYNAPEIYRIFKVERENRLSN
jgi:GH15 family glucan-1,4-alpha-glucosidase